VNGTSAAFDSVPGITSTIVAVGTQAYKEASASSYWTVFLATVAFTGVRMLSALFLPNVGRLLTKQVATTLHKRNEEGVVAA
jgi:hypothetical protein